MQKVSVFVRRPKSNPVYKNICCVGSDTVEDVIRECNLSMNGATIYMNGKRLYQDECDKPIRAFRREGFIYVSITYGETENRRKN